VGIFAAVEVGLYDGTVLFGELVVAAAVSGGSAATTAAVTLVHLETTGEDVKGEDLVVLGAPDLDAGGLGQQSPLAVSHLGLFQRYCPCTDKKKENEIFLI
jgi:hypothetical protein